MRLYALFLLALWTLQATSWNVVLRQAAEWYSSAEAIRIADNVLQYQHPSGGWDKNIDMAAPLAADPKVEWATIDNGATYTQLRFLAKVYLASKEEKYAAAFRKGLRYLLEAQYENGGWPQYYPLRKGYYTHITFNDDAMIGVMELLRDIRDRQPGFAFLSAADRDSAGKAIDKGVACILKCQIVVDGKRTVWCAQHDEVTFAPAQARAYEFPSLSGMESVGITRFLMGIDKPTPEIIDSIQSAVAWFESAKLTAIREVRKDGDKVTVKDPTAPPLWARFYEIGTNRPIFSGRDSVIRYNMSEIESERRNGYRWYVDQPGKLLAVDYPKWQTRIKR